MTQRIWAIALVVGGVVALLVSLFADQLGIGGSGAFGWRQIVGVLVGAGAAIVGAVMLRRGRGETNSPASTAEDF